jgi:hypothetical protein
MKKIGVVLALVAGLGFSCGSSVSIPDWAMGNWSMNGELFLEISPGNFIVHYGGAQSNWATEWEGVDFSFEGDVFTIDASDFGSKIILKKIDDSTLEASDYIFRNSQELKKM